MPPRRSMSARTDSALRSSLPLTTTVAPRAASRSATPLPIPPVPPVTMATLPSRLFIAHPRGVPVGHTDPVVGNS
nr:hypothetical protein JVH1_1213 [Rhodococcus sp. JVH1]